MTTTSGQPTDDAFESQLGSRHGRILVTGGFGFLGSHVLEVLLEEIDSEIHVVDDLSTNPVPIRRLLEEIGHKDRLTYELTSVAEFMLGQPGDFDAILHLASVVGPAGVLSHGGRIVASTVHDTYLLADYAMEHGCRLVDISTSEVYGGGRDGLCDEPDPKIVPAETTARSEYAVAKLAAETALINLHKRDGLDVVIIRPFNIAGPRQSGEGGFVLPRFLAQAHLRLPLTIFGDGQARRAFSHVRDQAEGVVLALIRGPAGRIYNLGNPSNKTTIDGLADVVLNLTGSVSPKEYIDPQLIYGPGFAEANDKFPAAGRAFHELGWAPQFGIDTVTKDAWEYMISVDTETFVALAGSKVVEQLIQSRAEGASNLANLITQTAKPYDNNS